MRLMIWNLERYGCFNGMVPEYNELAPTHLRNALIAVAIAGNAADAVIIQELRASGTLTLAELTAALEEYTTSKWNFDWIRGAFTADVDLENVKPDKLQFSANSEGYALLWREGGAAPILKPGYSAGINSSAKDNNYSGGGTKLSAMSLVTHGTPIRWERKGDRPEMTSYKTAREKREFNPFRLISTTKAKGHVHTLDRIKVRFEEIKALPADKRPETINLSDYCDVDYLRRPCCVNFQVGADKVTVVAFHAPVLPTQKEFACFASGCLGLSAKDLQEANRAIFAGDLNITHEERIAALEEFATANGLANICHKDSSPSMIRACSPDWRVWHRGEQIYGSNRDYIMGKGPGIEAHVPSYEALTEGWKAKIGTAVWSAMAAQLLCAADGIEARKKNAEHWDHSQTVIFTCIICRLMGILFDSSSKDFQESESGQRVLSYSETSFDVATLKIVEDSVNSDTFYAFLINAFVSDHLPIVCEIK